MILPIFKFHLVGVVLCFSYCFSLPILDIYVLYIIWRWLIFTVKCFASSLTFYIKVLNTLLHHSIFSTGGQGFVRETRSRQDRLSIGRNENAFEFYEDQKKQVTTLDFMLVCCLFFLFYAIYYKPQILKGLLCSS